MFERVLNTYYMQVVTIFVNVGLLYEAKYWKTLSNVDEVNCNHDSHWDGLKMM